MSKESFSQKINELMYYKVKDLEHFHIDRFFQKDEYFELILCISYFALSKEKIIHKNIKDDDRLRRLTKFVDNTSIDEVFQQNFCTDVPRIIASLETDNGWILDNIRDSIMHGAFDIDEENKCFIINNTQSNRTLKAEIPFSWFIAYAKYDILSKKELDNYTIKGFYYNINKRKGKRFDTRKETINNILYKVYICGTKFNVQDIEKRVNELFKQYSENTIEDSLIENYRTEIDSQGIKYNEKYLASFYAARDAIKSIIESEFPNTIVTISIDNKKQKLITKTSKKMNKFYKSYDLFYENINNIVRPKGIPLLNRITSLIENVDTFNQVDGAKLSYFDIMKLINSMMNDGDSEPLSYDKVCDNFQNNLKTLRSICLNIYGLSTLVINHKDLYDSYFQNLNPEIYGIRAYSKQTYLDYANNRKNLIMKILKLQIDLFSKKEQLNNCTNEQAIVKITGVIDKIEEDIKKIYSELIILDTGFQPFVRKNPKYVNDKEKFDKIIDRYFGHFSDANRVDDKKKIRKIIGTLLDKEITMDSQVTFGYCNMSDAITIIRNSFSHIGRIFVDKSNNISPIIVLSDYDNNGDKSGEVVCNYFDLINLLRIPFLDNNDTKQRVKK